MGPPPRAPVEQITLLSLSESKRVQLSYLAVRVARGWTTDYTDSDITLSHVRLELEHNHCNISYQQNNNIVIRDWKNSHKTVGSLLEAVIVSVQVPLRRCAESELNWKENRKTGRQNFKMSKICLYGVGLIQLLGYLEGCYEKNDPRNGLSVKF